MACEGVLTRLGRDIVEMTSIVFLRDWQGMLQTLAGW